MVFDSRSPVLLVVEGMGLDWKTQHRKLAAKFNTCITEMVIQLPGDTQNRAVTCLSLRKLPAWLYSIQPGKVSQGASNQDDYCSPRGAVGRSSIPCPPASRRFLSCQRRYPSNWRALPVSVFAPVLNPP
ncbi:phage antirepressor N-terminal domain-containing protein [Aeromonas veronii]|uniref:phage antirepressor N-terminal domain-containing protein n=1 Tax=Aeromonas veronii TaxID=654 RepID=UPI001302D5B1|nr:hypothetical protein GO977_00990 [Aeromonas veronii]